MANDDDGTKVRVDRLEKDVSKLQQNDEEKSKILSKMDRDSGKAEVYQEQILKNLADITATVAKTLDKTTETETLAKNLKVVTDKQSVDITAIAGEVTNLKMLPVENQTRTKWIWKTMIIGNIIGIVGLIIKFAPIIFKAIFGL